MLAIAGGVALALAARTLPGEAWMLPAALVGWPFIAFGLSWTVRERDPLIATLGTFALLVVLYWVGFAYKAAYLHKSHDDTVFLNEALAHADPTRPLLLNLDEESLEGLRI